MAYQNPYLHTPTILPPAIAAAGFRERQYDTGEVTINYVVGPRNGLPLVLIPAQMGTWESYQRVLTPLSRRFHVYALDVRGHGKSSWTPGRYNWEHIGGDMRAFLQHVVGRPAIVSGNSSGGIIALWCAANVPQFTAAAVLEDAPVFSAEMPRFKERDKFVYMGLEHAVATLGDLDHRDLAHYFKGLGVPVSATRVKRVPDVLVRFLSKKVRQAQAKYPDQPVRLDSWYMPHTLKLLFASLSQFDPDFARAFVDGRMYKGLDHAEALARVKCPLLVLHATWHRYPNHGLVGAMDDADAAHIQQLVPHAQYRKIPANHVIHMYKPRQFVAAIEAFAAAVTAGHKK